MDIQKVKRGIEYQDYLGTLATRLYICRIEKRPPEEDLIEELKYLQENHRIV